MDPNRLKGKNILITGAARGMGAANAEAFAAQGANVCLGDLDLDDIGSLAKPASRPGQVLPEPDTGAGRPDDEDEVATGV